MVWVHWAPSEKHHKSKNTILLISWKLQKYLIYPKHMGNMERFRREIKCYIAIQFPLCNFKSNSKLLSSFSCLGTSPFHAFSVCNLCYVSSFSVILDEDLFLVIDLWKIIQYVMIMEENLLSYVVFRAIKEFKYFVSSTVLHFPIDTQKNKHTSLGKWG